MDVWVCTQRRAVVDAGRQEHEIHHIKSMGVVVLGVSVSVEELRLALESAGLDKTMSIDREGGLSVTTIETDQADLYYVFSRFRDTNIWPALIAGEV